MISVQEFISTTLESLLKQVYSPCKVPAEEASISTAQQTPCMAEVAKPLPAPEKSCSKHAGDDQRECREEIQDDSKRGCSPVQNGKCLSELGDEDTEEALDFEEQLLEESALANEGPFDELTSDFFEDLDNETAAEMVAEEVAEDVKEIATPDHHENRMVVTPSQPPSFQTSLSQWSRGINSLGQCKQVISHPTSIFTNGV